MSSIDGPNYEDDSHKRRPEIRWIKLGWTAIERLLHGKGQAAGHKQNLNQQRLVGAVNNDATKAVIIKLATDARKFSKGDVYSEYYRELAEAALANNTADTESYRSQHGQLLERKMRELDQSIEIQAVYLAEADSSEVVECYVHAANPSRGSLVMLGTSKGMDRNTLRRIAHDLCLHLVASHKCQDVSEVLAQPFVREPALTVAHYLKACAKGSDVSIEVLRFLQL